MRNSIAVYLIFIVTMLILLFSIQGCVESVQCVSFGDRYDIDTEMGWIGIEYTCFVEFEGDMVPLDNYRVGP